MDPLLPGIEGPADLNSLTPEQLDQLCAELREEIITCETCHRIGPEDALGGWNGTDFAVFYGPKDTYQVHERQTENMWPLTAAVATRVRKKYESEKLVATSTGRNPLRTSRARSTKSPTTCSVMSTNS